MAPVDYLYVLSLILVVGKVFGASIEYSWWVAAAPAAVYPVTVLMREVFGWVFLRLHLWQLRRAAKHGFKVDYNKSRMN